MNGWFIFWAVVVTFFALCMSFLLGFNLRPEKQNVDLAKILAMLMVVGALALPLLWRYVNAGDLLEAGALKANAVYELRGQVDTGRGTTAAILVDMAGHIKACKLKSPILAPPKFLRTHVLPNGAMELQPISP
ncbi:MAG: hypothetical protein WC297_00090 [Candidatus Paceibacterota bacterium]|jgi:hypothetical protein